MAPDEADAGDFEQFREYLGILASQQAALRFQGKVDLSGLVQETLWEAHQQVARGVHVPAGQRLAWLRRILAHNLIDATRKLRAAKRDVRCEVSIEQSVEDSSVRMAAWLACDLPPGRAIEEEELMVGLAAALARLPADERESLVLHYSSDWTLAQIAEHLGRTRESVAGLIKRGVRRLRAELKQAESVHDRRRR